MTQSTPEYRDIQIQPFSRKSWGNAVITRAELEAYAATHPYVPPTGWQRLRRWLSDTLHAWGDRL